MSLNKDIKKREDKLLALSFYICVLAVVWILLQIVSFTSFRIPTDSMQPTLKPGDNILVNKWIMGVRIFDIWKVAEGKETKIHRLPGVGKVKRGDVLVFNFPYPNDSLVDWTVCNFGPMYIPKKGGTVKMDARQRAVYKNVIEWEQKKKLTLQNGHVCLGDSVIHEYSFTENYYFMVGDNAANSQDSRYWGLLPESFIVGKATTIWKSVNPATDEIRWDRTMKSIE